MALRHGDKGEAVKVVQRDLNRLGSLLVVDGDFGSTTVAAIVDARGALGRPGPPEADDALCDALARLPDPSPDLTAPGVTFIGLEEVSSPAAYRQRYKRPTWPTAPSGITIGIGYDLRDVSEATVRADWSGVLPEAALVALLRVRGGPGSQERLAMVSHIEIPLPAAVTVFLKRMVPTHTASTRAAYPMLDDLPPARRTALISLVFNRGGSLEGDRRREMKRIRELLQAGTPDAAADQLEAMVRLWDPAKERGLIERRRREAMLWRHGFEALRLV